MSGKKLNSLSATQKIKKRLKKDPVYQLWKALCVENRYNVREEPINIVRTCIAEDFNMYDPKNFE